MKHACEPPLRASSCRLLVHAGSAREVGSLAFRPAEDSLWVPASSLENPGEHCLLHLSWGHTLHQMGTRSPPVQTGRYPCSGCAQEPTAVLAPSPPGAGTSSFHSARLGEAARSPGPGAQTESPRHPGSPVLIPRTPTGPAPEVARAGPEGPCFQTYPVPAVQPRSACMNHGRVWPIMQGRVSALTSEVPELFIVFGFTG